MSNRYYITGVQLGMLLAYTEIADTHATKKLIDEIIDKQEVEKDIPYQVIKTDTPATITKYPFTPKKTDIK